MKNYSINEIDFTPPPLNLRLNNKIIFLEVGLRVGRLIPLWFKKNERGSTQKNLIPLYQTNPYLYMMGISELVKECHSFDVVGLGQGLQIHQQGVQTTRDVNDVIYRRYKRSGLFVQSRPWWVNQDSLKIEATQIKPIEAIKCPLVFHRRDKLLATHSQKFDILHTVELRVGFGSEDGFFAHLCGDDALKRFGYRYREITTTTIELQKIPLNPFEMFYRKAYHLFVHTGVGLGEAPFIIPKIKGLIIDSQSLGDELLMGEQLLLSAPTDDKNGHLISQRPRPRQPILV